MKAILFYQCGCCSHTEWEEERDNPYSDICPGCGSAGYNSKAYLGVPVKLWNEALTLAAEHPATLSPGYWQDRINKFFEDAKKKGLGEKIKETAP